LFTPSKSSPLPASGRAVPRVTKYVANFKLAQLHVQTVGETRRNQYILHSENRPGTKFSTKKSSAVILIKD
jgi:hypothetical protein